jgi:hypothetical protein
MVDNFSNTPELQQLVTFISLENNLSDGLREAHFLPRRNRPSSDRSLPTDTEQMRWSGQRAAHPEVSAPPRRNLPARSWNIADAAKAVSSRLIALLPG